MHTLKTVGLPLISNSSRRITLIGLRHGVNAYKKQMASLLLQNSQIRWVLRGNFSHLLSFAFLATLTLLVDAREVWDDDGNGQSNDQHSTQRTHAADELARDRWRHHVAIPATHPSFILFRLFANATQTAISQTAEPPHVQSILMLLS